MAAEFGQEEATKIGIYNNLSNYLVESGRSEGFEIKYLEIEGKLKFRFEVE